MHPLSAKVLDMLWNRADGADLRSSTKVPSIAFTAKTLPDYHALASAKEQDAVNADLAYAESQGAVAIDWDRRARGQQISHVRLVDFTALCTILGRSSSTAKIEAACARLAPYQGWASVQQLIEAWKQGASPRKISLDHIDQVVDACKVVSARVGHEQAPISQRRVSAKVLGNSKRIEQIIRTIDVVRNGLEVEPQALEAIYEQLSMIKYPQVMLLAGPVDVLLASGEEMKCHRPYVGAPPHIVRGVRGKPMFILTIENLTVFQEMARGAAGSDETLLIYTGGHVGSDWLAAYEKILDSVGCPIFHWGDTDVGGFTIAAELARSCIKAGVPLNLFKMGQYAPEDANIPLQPNDIARIRAIAEQYGWVRHLEVLEQCQKGIEQELQELEALS